MGIRHEIGLLLKHIGYGGAARGIPDNFVIGIAAPYRKHLRVGARTHDHTVGLAEAGSGRTVARAIFAVTAIVAAEDNVHSARGQRADQIFAQRVSGIVNEAVGVPRRKILKARMEQPPAVADDKSGEGPLDPP